MTLSWRILLPLYLSVIFLPTVTMATAVDKTFFTSPEHLMIGNNVFLRFPSGGQSTNFIFHLPNGITATYGEIVTMPDFYGILDTAISQGQSKSERRTLFLEGYNSFAVDTESVDEAIKILAAIHSEQLIVDKGIERGEKPEVIYKKMGHEFDRQYNCITGGGCLIDTFWFEPGRYLALANGKSNYDHFGDNALIAYKTGHQIALEQAAAAHQNGDVKMLISAYAINAFACHFLSDRFASGHIRTPRLELSEHTIPVTAGSLLAAYMHNEENEYGLHVHNSRGDHWIAYGDKAYFTPEIKTHLKILGEAMQYSADAVFTAFLHGSSQVEDKVIDLIPQADEAGNAGIYDISPLFYWDVNTSTLMRRSETTKYYDRHWTKDWWGWSTYLKLRNERVLLTDNDQTIFATKQRQQAMQSGLISTNFP